MSILSQCVVYMIPLSVPLWWKIWAMCFKRHFTFFLGTWYMGSCYKLCENDTIENINATFVAREIPLFVSCQYLKWVHCHIDFVQDKMFCFENRSLSGLRKPATIVYPSLVMINRRLYIMHYLILLSNLMMTKQLKSYGASKAVCTPLFWLSKTSDLEFTYPNPIIYKVVDDVSRNCDVFERFRRTPLYLLLVFHFLCSSVRP